MRKAPPPYGTATFCDDFRQEVGNKVTLVGVYSGDMTFPQGVTFPLGIPKLVVRGTWVESTDTDLNEITFKVGIRKFDSDPDADDDQAFGEIRFDAPDIKAVREQRPDTKNPLLFLNPVFMLSPCFIPFPGLLRVRALRNGEWWAISGLSIREPPKPDGDSPQSAAE